MNSHSLFEEEALKPDENIWWQMILLCLAGNGRNRNSLFLVPVLVAIFLFLNLPPKFSHGSLSSFIAPLF